MPAITFEAKIVTEKEWERLISSDPRYEHVTDDNMGFADPKFGKAYVRQTYWSDLNKYLLQHEFEHLLEEEGTDEDEHGIRHKKGFLRNAAAILSAPFTGGSSLFTGSEKERPILGKPGGFLNEVANPIYQYGLPIAGSILGSPLGPVGSAGGAGLGSAIGNFATGQGGLGRKAVTAGALAGAGNVLGQGLGGFFGRGASTTSLPTQPYNASAYGGFQNRLPGTSQASFGNLFPTQSSLPGVQRQPGSIFSPSAGGFSPLGVGVQRAPLTQNSFPSFGTNPTQSTLTGTVGGPGGGSGAGGGGNPGGGLGQFLSQIGQGFQSTMPLKPGSFGQGIGQFLGSNLGNIAQLTAAAGTLGIGQRAPAAQVPPIPDLTQIPRIQNIEQTAGRGLPVSPVGQVGQQDLMARLNTPFQGVNAQVLQSIRDSFDRQRRDFASQFKTVRPNADIASDSDYARNLALLDRQEAQAIGEVQQQEFTRFQAERTNDIATALGIDRNTLGTLMDVAQLDIDRIQTQFGISAEQAQQFKNTFGQLAALIAARPLGLTSFKA